MSDALRAGLVLGRSGAALNTPRTTITASPRRHARPLPASGTPSTSTQRVRADHPIHGCLSRCFLLAPHCATPHTPQVHSLDSEEGDALQRLIRAVNCNFLALSATIGNAQQVRCGAVRYSAAQCGTVRCRAAGAVTLFLGWRAVEGGRGRRGSEGALVGTCACLPRG